ncbi:proline-rich receptor-like protein kinase PERK3 isoform X2 [Wolffia australiana]
MAGAGQRNPTAENVVVVAVKAEKEITKTPLAWALTHIVRPGDFVTLLAIIGNSREQRRWQWSFPKLNSVSRGGRRKGDVSASCGQMALQFHGFDEPGEVNIRIKVVIAGDPAAPPTGTVAAESKLLCANWIVLDGQLKQEVKGCLAELPHCSVVLMKRSHAKVLRLNLGGAAPLNKPQPCLTPPSAKPSRSPPRPEEEEEEEEEDDQKSPKIKHPTPASSGGEDSSFVSFLREYRQSSSSSCTATAGRSSPFFSEVLLRSRRALNAGEVCFAIVEEVAPALCSVCRLKAAGFGRAARWFGYGELEAATEGFSEGNFVAEGGLGWVHRGVLADGRVVAVKTLKALAGPDREQDEEFRAEVEVLSRAQHRHVVLLLGFCAEGPRRVLVYEYVCHGSLALHLHGRNTPPLDWAARVKIAMGAARGLRYLHEDCRVGFVHHDVRPSNILLTHDFQPLVGDYGLGRWMTEVNGTDLRMIGKFGYLAPEYIESGAMTEKADIYAFGVVLLELITGRRAVDMGRAKGQQLLSDWARPSLTTPSALGRILDPWLDPSQTARQATAMATAASLCLRRDPLVRPTMSQVIRILEGERMVADLVGPGEIGPRGSHSQRMAHDAVRKALLF